jgi:hypothetical protein
MPGSLSIRWCRQPARRWHHPRGELGTEGRGAARWRRHQLARLGENPVLRFSEVRKSRSSWSTSAPIALPRGRRGGGPTVAAIGNAVARARHATARPTLTRERVMAALLRRSLTDADLRA